jgi:anaerobic selenocysteine-containing dehydrogenase
VRGLAVYQQQVATNKNSMTDTYFDGLPMYRGIFDCTETALDPGIWKEYPFQLHTWKDTFHTQSRTMNNLWLASIKPQNWAELNPADAEKLGVASGDWIKARSPSSKPNDFFANSIGEGWFKFQVRVTSRVRPGLFSVCQAYGRFGAGARRWTMNGKSQPHDERIGAGFHLNPLYMVDPILKNRVMIDPVSGGTQSFGTPIKIEKL